MRIPDLTTSIRQALLDRHAQVNQTEAIVALRSVAGSRNRPDASRSTSVNRGRRDSESSDFDEEPSNASESSVERGSGKRRGRFVDVEV